MPDVHLVLPYRTLDDRIGARGLLDGLRRDPNVLDLGCRQTEGVLTTTVTIAEPLLAPELQSTLDILAHYRADRYVAEPEPVPNQNGDALPPLQQFFGALQGEPLRRNRDYQSTGRPAFLVDEIPEDVFAQQPIPLVAVAPRNPDVMYMDRRDYDDLVGWASNVIQTKSVLPQPEVTTTPEPEPPTFWERLLKDDA